MALATYHPEMNQAKPAADFEASLSYAGRHYIVKTRRALAGRGITFLRTISESEIASHVSPERRSVLVGMHEYKVTEKVFKALCQAETVSMETLL